MSSSRRLAILVRIAGLAVLGVLLAVFAHRIDWRVMGRALKHAELWPLGLALLLYLASLFGKALVWRILLAPHNRVPVARLYRYTIVAFAAGMLTPARAGEAVRVWALKQRDGVATADSTGVAVTDKLLHAVALLVLAAPLPLLLPSLPGWVGDALLVCAGIAAGILATIYIAVGRVEAREPHSWFARFVAGMRAVREPGRLLAVLGVIALVWTCDLFTIMVVLRAVDVEVSIAGALFIMFTTNLAIAVPTTPANVGTLQLGALVATRLLGIPSEPALAFALLYHAIQIAPPLVVGFALEYRLMIPAGARGKLAA